MFWGSEKKSFLLYLHFIASRPSCEEEEEEGQGNDEGTVRGGWEQPQWFSLTLLLLLSPPPVLLMPPGSTNGLSQF